MVKLGRRKGLVRYDSQIGLNGGKTRYLRSRTLLYTLLAAVGLVVFAIRASSIAPMSANALRMSGSAFYVSDGTIRNHFQVRVINKRNEPSSYTFSVEGEVPEEMRVVGNESELELSAQGEDLKSLVFMLPQAAYAKPLKMVVRVTEAGTGRSIKTMPIEFTGPDPQTQNQDYLDVRQYLQQ